MNIIYNMLVNKMILLCQNKDEYIFGVAFKYVKPDPDEEELLDIFHAIIEYQHSLPKIPNIVSKCFRELVIPGREPIAHYFYPFGEELDYEYIVEGFITTNGRFLNRQESNGYVKVPKNNNKMLLTEEIPEFQRYEPLYDMVEN